MDKRWTHISKQPAQSQGVLTTGCQIRFVTANLSEGPFWLVSMPFPRTLRKRRAESIHYCSLTETCSSPGLCIGCWWVPVAEGACGHRQDRTPPRTPQSPGWWQPTGDVQSDPLWQVQRVIAWSEWTVCISLHTARREFPSQKQITFSSLGPTIHIAPGVISIPTLAQYAGYCLSALL